MRGGFRLPCLSNSSPLFWLESLFHKPLVPLLSSKGLDELPPLIQRFRMRLFRFQFQISHVPGKDLITADALSRQPLPE